MTAIPLHLHPEDQSKGARERRMELAVVMAQINPHGFRQPGLRHGTSHVERRTVAAGYGDEPELYRSARGDRKREARRLHIETVLEQQQKEREKREALSRALARAIGGVSAFD